MSKNFSDLSPKQLRQAAVLKERIETLQAELNGLLGQTASTANSPSKKSGKKGKKRTMSPEARAKISAAQKKRWQKEKKKASGAAA